MALSADSADGVTVGIDLGDRYSHFCELDARGDILEEGRLATTPAAFRRRFSSRMPARVAIEAGAQSAWVARLLRDYGHEVLVANPRKVRLIYENDRKTDRIDAHQLARVARADPQLLYPIEHRPLSAHRDLATLRTRQALVRARTQLVNHVRATTKAFGARLPKCSTACLPKRCRAALPQELLVALAGLLDVVETLNGTIQDFDARVEHLISEAYPETARLSRVPGVGPITALTIGSRATIRSASGAAARSARTWACARGNAPRERRTASFASPRQAIPICGAFWSAVLTTRSVPSGPIRTCAAGDSPSPRGRKERQEASHRRGGAEDGHPPSPPVGHRGCLSAAPPAPDPGEHRVERNCADRLMSLQPRNQISPPRDLASRRLRCSVRSTGWLRGHAPRPQGSLQRLRPLGPQHAPSRMMAPHEECEWKP